MRGYTLFPTDLGDCGIAWGPQGVVRFTLPDTAEAQGAALGLVAPAAEPPPPVAAVITRVQGLLAGTQDRLLDVPVDLDGVPEFNQRVYAVTREIPPGEVLTYGRVAELVGVPGSAQAVGRALGRNPVPVIVPCHRVMGADGRMVGFSAPGGTTTKLRLLAVEGAADPYGQEALF